MSVWGTGGSSTHWQFKDKHTLARRQAIAEKLKTTHPDRVPVIVQPMPGSGLALTRCKFLTPGGTRMGRFMQEVRRALEGGEDANQHAALFLLVGEAQVLVPTGATAQELRARHQDAEDGMVYMQVARESTFG
jgi:hypothetical protein